MSTPGVAPSAGPGPGYLPVKRTSIASWLGQYSKAIAAAAGVALTIATAVYAGTGTPHWLLLVEGIATALGVWVAPNRRL